MLRDIDDGAVDSGGWRQHFGHARHGQAACQAFPVGDAERSLGLTAISAW
jgi:hypothetical protein